MQVRTFSVLALLALLVVPSAHANDPQPPDLCAEPVRAADGSPYADTHGQIVSRFCDPRIDPPVLDKDVCCSISDTASCKLPDAVGRCTSGMKFWCEYGAPIGSGRIECYQDGPSACAAGFCQSPGSYTGPGEIFDDSSWVCCSNTEDECVYVGESGAQPPPGVTCAGTLTICSWGATNEDGTVDCLG